MSQDSTQVLDTAHTELFFLGAVEQAVNLMSQHWTVHYAQRREDRNRNW